MITDPDHESNFLGIVFIVLLIVLFIVGTISYVFKTDNKPNEVNLKENPKDTVDNPFRDTIIYRGN